MLIPAALSSVMFPKISELHGAKDYKKAKSTLKKIILAYTPMAIAGIIGTLMFSEQMIYIVAPSYLPGLAIFKALVSFGFILGYVQLYRTYLTAKGKIKKLAFIILLQNILLLAMSLAAV